jgi:hypothetical protein
MMPTDRTRIRVVRRRDCCVPWMLRFRPGTGMRMLAIGAIVALIARSRPLVPTSFLESFRDQGRSLMYGIGEVWSYLSWSATLLPRVYPGQLLHSHQGRRNLSIQIHEYPRYGPHFGPAITVSESVRHMSDTSNAVVPNPEFASTVHTEAGSDRVLARGGLTDPSRLRCVANRIRGVRRSASRSAVKTMTITIWLACD